MRATLPADAMAWATPNADDRSGGHDQASRERRKWKAAQERNKGLVPGIPDLFVLYQGRLTGIELKRPPATLKNGAKSRQGESSESQQAITPRLEAAGRVFRVPLARRCPSRPDRMRRPPRTKKGFRDAILHSIRTAR